MSGLDIAGVRKSFGTVAALDDISLSINDGELYFLLGPSGCGKTTLLRVIAGFCLPDNGTVTFRGSDLLSIPIERRNIGMVFQNYSLWPHMTVHDNVAYGLRMRGSGGADMERKVGEALELVDMAGLGSRKPAELSGGQQQRVALARALVYEPEILLLDEPLSNLDAKLRKDMRREIRALHERLGITMVYVTHDQEEAATMADRIALLRDGRLVQVGPPAELYRYPETVYAAEFFGRANCLKTVVSGCEGQTVHLTWGQAKLSARVPEDTSPPEQGSAVVAIVRPEDIEFGDSGANVLNGTVSDHEFNGSVESFTIAVDEKRSLSALGLHRPDARPALKSTVTVCIAPESIHLVSAGGDA